LIENIALRETVSGFILDDFLSRKHNLFVKQQKYGISHWITSIGGRYDDSL
jgi:hypothetical protein